MRAIEQDRPDVVEQSTWWHLQQAGLDPAYLVLIDETWAMTNVTRRRSRAWRGTRLVIEAPHGHWKTDDLRRGAAH